MYLQPRNYQLIKKSEKSREPDTTWFEERIERIIRIMGSDPAMFVLAVHSFVEGFIRETYGIESEENFSVYDLIEHLREELKKRRKGWIRELGILSDIKLAQALTNRVRHRFDPLNQVHAAEAGHRLIQFCKLVQLPVERYSQRLHEATKLWDRGRDRLADVQELNEKSFLLLQARREQEQVEEELKQYHQLRSEHRQQQQTIADLEEKLSLHLEADGEKSEKVEELRNERFALKEKNRRLIEKIKELKHAGSYVREMRSLIAYTRTRSDYERSILKLTKEQKRVLEQITLQDDFLIKGGAGTGKTLVLLKVLEQALHMAKQDLPFNDDAPSIALLTYNKTLARYDSYIAQIMSLADIFSSIGTSDAFLFEQFRKLGPGVIDSTFIGEVISRNNHLDFFDDQELMYEIDQVIFGSLISKEEYLDEMIIRHGRETPLSQAQRRAVWDIVEMVIEKMHREGRFSKQFAARLLAETAGEERQMVDFLFVDEVQDLSSAELKALKNCTRRCIILAGDADQSIYQTRFPLKRSRINIQGHTRILRTNFRNTIQIQDFAEAYRKAHPEIGYDEENQPEAFRSGPPPELSCHASRSESYSALLERIDILVHDFLYAPENICILTADKNSIGSLQKQLASKGYKSYNIRESDFNFLEPEVIRLSTLHSAKGLEFPVVLLCLEGMPFTGSGHKPEEELKLQRHLIYVALSRAMDYLHIFLSGDELHQEFKELISGSM